MNCTYLKHMLWLHPWSHHHHEESEHTITPKISSCSFVTIPITCPQPQTIAFCRYRLVCISQDFVQMVLYNIYSFCPASFIWYNYLEIHPCYRMNRYFILFPAELYSIELIYHSLFIHSSVDGHLDGFQFLVIMNKGAMNIFVQIFIWHMLSFLQNG